MKLRVEWLPGPEAQLLHGIQHLATIMAICEAVERFAATFDGQPERIADGKLRAVRLPIAGRVVVMLRADALLDTYVSLRRYPQMCVRLESVRRKAAPRGSGWVRRWAMALATSGGGGTGCGRTLAVSLRSDRQCTMSWLRFGGGLAR